MHTSLILFVVLTIFQLAYFMDSTGNLSKIGHKKYSNQDNISITNYIGLNIHRPIHHNNQKHWASLTTPGSKSSSNELPPNCGIRYNRYARITNRLIVGGFEINPYMYPSFLRLEAERQDGFGQVCGATLISNRIALTAAHCIKIIEKNPLIDLNLYSSIHRNLDDDSVKFPVIEAWSLPDRDIDVALLKLSKPLNFSRTLQTACLAEDSTDSSEPSIALGLSDLDSANERRLGIPDIKLTALPVKKFHCPRRIPANYCVRSNVKWYSGLTCLGDSGGPIYVDKNGRQTLVGIISKSHRDCSKKQQTELGRTIAVDIYNVRDLILDLIKLVGGPLTTYKFDEYSAHYSGPVRNLYRRFQQQHIEEF